MISFSVLNADNFEALIAEIFADKEKTKAAMNILSEIDFEDGNEYAITGFASCLLIRICALGRYAFPIPIALDGEGNIGDAILEIAKYAVKEEIEFTLCSLHKDDFSLLRGFLHINLDAEDGTGEYYTASIKNECQLLCEIPEEIGGRVTLNALSESDIAEYARLCRDAEISKYWGYDYREDYGEVEDGFFFESQTADFERGNALTLAVRLGDVLIGSLEFYAFDYLGGAEIDIRLFGQFRGFGYACEALTLALRVAKRIGLKKIYSTVMNENLSSLRLFSKFMSAELDDGKISRFSLDI